MRRITRLPDDPDTSPIDGQVVDTEVEIVRTTHLAGTAVDAMAATPSVVSERNADYVETLAERINGVGLVVRTAIEVLLSIRFLLHASAANSSNAFVVFVDGASWPFVRPFANAFSNPSLGPIVIDVSALVAMAMYFIIFALLGMLVTALARLFSGATARHDVTTLRASEALSATDSPLADAKPHRRPRLTAATSDMRKHRRLLRVAHGRKP